MVKAGGLTFLAEVLDQFSLDVVFFVLVSIRTLTLHVVVRIVDVGRVPTEQALGTTVPVKVRSQR